MEICLQNSVLVIPYVKFSKKLTFLSPWYADVEEIIDCLENFGYVLNGRFLTILQDWNLVHCQKNYIFYILRFVKINSDEYLGVLFLTSSQVLLVLSQYILFGSPSGKVLWIHACLHVCTSVSTSVVLYLAFLEICSLVFPEI